MNAPAERRGPAPEVDEGDARDLVALLRRELRPTPGRLGDCLRIVVVLLALVAIAETFRIPEIALSGYIVLFLSGREAASTILTALLAGIAVPTPNERAAGLMRLDQTETLGARYRLRAPLHGELRKNVFDVRLHRLGRNTKVAGDLLVGLAVADQLQNVTLTSAQRLGDHRGRARRG
jgi:hypothetical protein